MKRILLLADDPMLGNFYREKFEALGLAVDLARANDAARLAGEKAHDLALIDPILPVGSSVEIVHALRAALGLNPMFVFTSTPAPILSAVEKAGVNKAVQRNGHVARSVVEQVQQTLGLPVNPEAAAEEITDDAWIKTVLDEAPERINGMRMSVHAFIKEPGNSDLLFDLFRQIHVLSERTAVVGLTAVYRFTSALEAFIYDLYAMPEQVNPSVIRTLTQSIDFLSFLFSERNVRRAQSPSKADVLVVDDEPDARRLVSVAMEQLDLKLTCAGEVEMAMSILEDNPFDLIFLDVNLPGASGFDICAQIRQTEDHKKTPIIFVTGMTDFKTRAQSTLSGGNDFVGKPFNILELGIKALIWIFKHQLGPV